MPDQQLFVFTAGNPEARAHLDDSIRRAVSLERALPHFSGTDADRVRRIADEHDLYAWGAIPGRQNTPRWEALEPGDWVLCVFDHRYRFVARLIDKFDNESFAKDVWGTDPQGRTWSLMYFLTEPRSIDIAVNGLSNYLNRSYMGFSRISDDKIQRIATEYGSLERFIETELLQRSEGSDEFVEIPDGITREDVLQAIRDYNEGVPHGFAESTKYDLVYEIRRYPPKAIIGLGARRIIGRPLRPSEFSGGEDSKCFRVLRQLGFVIEPKLEAQGYLLIRLNEQSQYDDELGVRYSFSSHVPNHKKLLDGAWVVVDRRSSEGAQLIGHGKLEAAETVGGDQGGPTAYQSKFSEWHSMEPPTPLPEELLSKIRALPNYNVQHAIRVINQELYNELVAAASLEPLCLLGTARTIMARLDGISQHIKDHDGWAMDWSFVLPETVLPYLREPFWLYANTGGGTFPVRFQVVEYKRSSGAEGIESPWPELTDAEHRGRTRLGPQQSQVFKTWFRVAAIEELNPPLTISDFLPAAPWSNDRNILNQNAFGFARRKAEIPKRAIRPFTTEDALKQLFMSSEQLGAILAGLERKKNVVLQGPPGVGKSFAAGLIAYVLMGADDDDRIGMVQFHQSYAYEDFVQGWRPTEAGGFYLHKGIFYEFCREAAKRRYEPFVFIIDEINRGNLSKIMGELMMLIEPDKRGEKFAIPLTYSKTSSERFFVPENVYLIGLMNTADRSLAMVDYALRRRFSFFSLAPEFRSEGFAKHLETNGASGELIKRIRTRLDRVNAEISENPHLGTGFRVGHSYFCITDGSLPNDDWYKSVIQAEIAPLLKEYWFDQTEIANSLIDELLA